MTQGPLFQASTKRHVQQDKVASVWVAYLRYGQFSEERDAKVVLAYGYSQLPASPLSPSS